MFYRLFALVFVFSVGIKPIVSTSENDYCQSYVECSMNARKQLATCTAIIDQTGGYAPLVQLQSMSDDDNVLLPMNEACHQRLAVYYEEFAKLRQKKEVMLFECLKAAAATGRYNQSEEDSHGHESTETCILPAPHARSIPQNVTMIKHCVDTVRYTEKRCRAFSRCCSAYRMCQLETFKSAVNKLLSAKIREIYIRSAECKQLLTDEDELKKSKSYDVQSTPKNKPDEEEQQEHSSQKMDSSQNPPNRHLQYHDGSEKRRSFGKTAPYQQNHRSRWSKQRPISKNDGLIDLEVGRVPLIQSN